jgi:aspartyl-tRNA(Asn)/glutamyl-tRNA(Gln) amidotransferase subunit A
MEPHLAKWRDQMDPAITSRLDAAATMTAVDFEKATHRRTALWQVVARFFARYDLLITPTTSVTAFPLGRSFPEEIAGRRFADAAARRAAAAFEAAAPWADRRP